MHRFVSVKPYSTPRAYAIKGLEGATSNWKKKIQYIKNLLKLPKLLVSVYARLARACLWDGPACVWASGSVHSADFENQYERPSSHMASSPWSLLDSSLYFHMMTFLKSPGVLQRGHSDTISFLLQLSHMHICMHKTKTWLAFWV